MIVITALHKLVELICSPFCSFLYVLSEIRSGNSGLCCKICFGKLQH